MILKGSEEWSRIPPYVFSDLITNFIKRFMAVIFARGVTEEPIIV